MNFENTSQRQILCQTQFSPSSSRHQIKLLVCFCYRIITSWDGHHAVWQIGTNVLQQPAIWSMTVVSTKLPGVTCHKTVAIRPPDIQSFHCILQSFGLLNFKNHSVQSFLILVTRRVQSITGSSWYMAKALGFRIKVSRSTTRQSFIHFLFFTSDKAKTLWRGGKIPSYLHRSVIVVTIIIISHHQEQNG